MSKELLRELMGEIKKCKKPCRTNPWFFLKNGVFGFVGDGQVMFVRGNPLVEGWIVPSSYYIVF